MPLTTLESTARELFSVYRSADMGSRIWFELTEPEQNGWRKIAGKFLKLEKNFQIGDLVQAAQHIGQLFNEDHSVETIFRGDRGTVIALDEDEPQPLTVHWGKGPINDCYLDEVEHDVE